MPYSLPTNSDKLTGASTAIIQEFADAMKENPSLKIKIIGHTDNDGDDEKNIALSKKRAAAVKAKLVTMGIANSRLQTDGKGEKEPVADNETTDGKSKPTDGCSL